MKREELKFCWGEAFLDCDVYEKEEADKVMDAMEARIKELEEQCTKYQAELMNNDPALNPTISKMETTQKWISVKDRLPEDGACVLCSNGFGVQSIDIYSKQLGFYDDGEFMWVTHWMPLPPPPTTEEK